MLVFGHTGITLGATILLQTAINKHYRIDPVKESSIPISPVRDFTSNIDFRLILLGSLLPDLIDKPLGVIIFRETLSYGRIYAHTLLLTMLLLLFGFILYRYKKGKWSVTLAIGTFYHLILDEMWLTPGVLLWPVLGLAFPREDVSDYLSLELNKLVDDPLIIMTELIGLIVLIGTGVYVLKKTNGVRDFLTKGWI